MEGNTALHEAALGGNEQVVDILLQAYPDLANEINKLGETALFKACEGGHTNIVKKLCIFTPNRYNKRIDGQTPLHLAVTKLRIDVIEELLLHKSELATDRGQSNRTPLHMAALIRDSSEKIRKAGEMLLDKDFISCYKVDENRQSALHVAAKEGNVTLVKLILRYSRDSLEMRDGDGRNALHLAVNNAAKIFVRVGPRALKTLIFLVMSEKLINCPDMNSQTALDIAVENEDKDPQLYIGIQNYLRKVGATSNKLDPGLETISSIFMVRKPNLKSDFISVVAVLIATVAFAAAFTLPGGLNSQAQGPPAPILINTTLFKLFVIFDTLAFCYAISSAFLCNFAVDASKLEDPTITESCFAALWAALLSLLLTFGAAMHLVVASKSLWLAVLVWVAVCVVPIYIKINSLEGRAFLFTPRKDYIMILLVEFILLPLSLFPPIVWIVRVGFRYYYYI